MSKLSLRALGFGLAALLAFGDAAPARAADEVPTVISPLRFESDPNGVNLTDGRTVMEMPVLSVPGAPNLRFDRLQNAAPYLKGTVETPLGTEIDVRRYAIHTGTGASDSFRCENYISCASVTGTGSTFRYAGRRYQESGSGAIWTFGVTHSSFQSSQSPYQTMVYYASSVAYPNGEVITYSYTPATMTGDPVPGRIFRRPATIASNLGYYIALTYAGDDFNGDMAAWGRLTQAAIYSDANPGVPLGRLSYGAGTITDHGSRALTDDSGRIHSCTGCSNTLGIDIEVSEGSMQLPGDGSPTRQVAPAAGLPQSAARPVGSVTRDGVTFSYSYDNPRGQSGSLNSTLYGYLYDHVTVTDPDGHHVVYDVAQRNIPMSNIQQNVISRVTDSLNRSTSYEFDTNYRVTGMVYPEQNRVDVVYDEFGNITSRTATPGPNMGQAISEGASYPTATCVVDNTSSPLCWRPTWTRDGLQRQTDYAYNLQGQLTERLEPAAASGVPRRRTSIAYGLYPTPFGQLSRRRAVRICADTGATCGDDAPIRTEYEYWGATLLPSIERRIDAAAGETLTTTYGYDAAGRLLSTDGPMEGTADTSYNRYDIEGRLAGTISPDPDGAGDLPRLAVRNSYDGAGRLVRVETGTLAALQAETVRPADWTGFTAASTVETVYDGAGRKTRDTLREGSAGTIRSVTQYSYDASGRLDCTAVRMNPATFASPPEWACAAAQAGSDGPDRITRNFYDAAGQRVQLREGVGTPDNAAVATWAYNANGQVTTLIDANGNRAELHYDGHGRQDRWTFPSPTRPAAYDDSEQATALVSAGAVNAADYEAYIYDAAGNRLSLRKRDTSTINYQYDNLNRLIVKLVPERPSGPQALTAAQTRDVHYGYDLGDRQLYARFDSATGPGITNFYDGFGRLTSTVANTDGVSRTLSYRYDPAGGRTRITHPDLAWFDTLRDGLGRAYWLNSAVYPAYGCYYSAYRADGPPGSRSRCNGSSTWVSRDAIGRLNGLGHYYGAGGAGDVLWLYDHNAASQIRSASRDNDSYAWTRHYAVQRAYATNGLNQYTGAVSALGSASYGYDQNGNLTSDGSRTYVYDIENRLVSAAPGGTLDYDPLGRLYRITATDGTVTRFLYDGDALVAEYDAAGALAARYVHWDGADVPIIAYTAEGAPLGSPTYLHPDHQGSIVAISGASGVSQINRYDEYGIPASTNAGRFQYTGQAWLAELGMYYYKARIYSPTLGRFMQTDPIGYEDQFNLYAYVGNDPVNSFDPTGQECSQVSDKRTHCDPPGRDTPGWSLPIIPGGVSDLQPSDANYHSYRVDTVFEADGSNNLYDRVAQAVISDPTPGTHDRPASPGGTSNESAASYFTMPDTVRSFTARNESNTITTVVNVTESDHMGSPGYVAHYVMRLPSGSVRLTTVGEGRAWFQNTFDRRNRAATTVWRSHHLQIRRHIRWVK